MFFNSFHHFWNLFNQFMIFQYFSSISRKSSVLLRKIIRLLTERHILLLHPIFSMTILFSIKDCAGKTIHLSRERWKHILKHQYMTESLEDLKETLMRPDLVQSFSHDDHLRFFYRYYKHRKKYLFVLVRYLNGNGFIITGFYTDKIR